MTDQEILTLLQYALVEPPDGGAAWPSGLWTRDEVLNALNTRIRQYLRDTHAIATRVEIAVPQLTNPVSVPADWIGTLAGVWRDQAGIRYPLTPCDAFEIDLVVPTWELTAAVPIVILDGDDGSLTVRLGPIPAIDGTLELLYVASPTGVNGAGASLPLPDEVLDGIKYGTLADLLGKVGRGSDPMRAQYCQERFELNELVTEIILGGWA